MCTKSGLFGYLLELERAGQQKISGVLDRLCVVGGCNYRIAGAKIEVDDHIKMHHANAQILTQRLRFWWIRMGLEVAQNPSNCTVSRGF